MSGLGSPPRVGEELCLIVSCPLRDPAEKTVDRSSRSMNRQTVQYLHTYQVLGARLVHESDPGLWLMAPIAARR
jgi:hypothetical protein